MRYRESNGALGWLGRWGMICAVAAANSIGAQAQTAPVLLVSSTAMNFKAGLGQNPEVQSVLVGSSFGTLTLSANSSTTSGGDWLQVSFDSGTTPATIKVSPATANLPVGTYQGQIQISSAPASNSPLTINVTATVASPAVVSTLTVAPAALNFVTVLNGNSPPDQVITVGPADSSVGFTVTTAVQNTPQQWLQVTPVSGTTPQALSVSVNPRGLSGGTYSGTVTLVPNAPGTASVSVTVTLTVTTLPTLNFTPAQGIQFYYQTNSTGLPAPQGLVLSASTGSLSLTLQPSTGNGIPWLTVGQSAVLVGTSPAQIPVGLSAAVAGFAPGSYSGSILITTPGATNASVTIPVSLVVSPLPLMTVSNSLLPFNYRAGAAPPPPQLVQIGPNAAPALQYTTSVILPPGQNWLTVTPDQGQLPMTLSISVDGSGLSTGTYTGQIRVGSLGAANSPVTLPVTLNVSANGFLTVSPGQLDFNFQLGMGVPDAQILDIGTTGGTATFQAQTLTNDCGGAWLKATPATGSAPGQVKVTANPLGMTMPATCAGKVALVNQASLQTLIPVNLNVSSTPLLNVSPRVMTFTGVAGGAAPAVQTIQLASTDPNGPFDYAAQTLQTNTLGAGSWLSIVGGANGRTPGTVQVAATLGNLAPGTYSGLIQIRSSGQIPLQIPVTLVVTSNVTLGVSPPSVTFSSTLGTSPGPQIVNVTAQGGTLPFTATASSNLNWMSLTPASANTPWQLIVSANAAGLNPGTYPGSITVASGGAANPVVTIPTSFVVLPPQSLAVTPQMLSFNVSVGDPPPFAQTITLSPSVGTVPFTASVETGTVTRWLQLSAVSGAAPTMLSAKVDATGLLPGLYTATVTITPTGLPQVLVTVSLTVTAVPLPSLSGAANGASLVEGAIAPGEIVVVKGANVGAPGDAVVATLNPDGSLPTTVSDTQVLFDTFAAPILEVENNQVTVVVPYEVNGQTATLIQAKHKGVFSNLMQIPVTQTAPGVFTTNVPVAGFGAIVNADGSVNSAINPAVPGTDVRIYYTGDGQTNPPTATNSVYPTNALVPYAIAAFSASIGGTPATVTSYGGLPGSFAGVSTATITVPTGLGAGGQPLVVNSDVSQSQRGLFVYVSN